MSSGFDLTATEELSANRGESIASLATKVRNASPEFDGTHSQDDVVRQLLEERLSQLREEAEKAEEKRASLRSRMGLQSTEEASGSSQTEVEAKQAELRERIGQ